MAWLLIIVAGLFEVGFATFLKLSDGFSRLLPSIGFFVCSAISFSLLAEAAKPCQSAPHTRFGLGFGRPEQQSWGC
jgi:multidrug transporter EmrE-like cation transporter